MRPPANEIVVGEDNVLVHGLIVPDIGDSRIGVVGSVRVISIDGDS